LPKLFFTGAGCTIWQRVHHTQKAGLTYCPPSANAISHIPLGIPMPSSAQAHGCQRAKQD
jgi:hypothetical protein